MCNPSSVHQHAQELGEVGWLVYLLAALFLLRFALG
jgi:hypothetical protein